MGDNLKPKAEILLLALILFASSVAGQSQEADQGVSGQSFSDIQGLDWSKNVDRIDSCDGRCTVSDSMNRFLISDGELI